jgi:hypothetical protein
MWIFHPLPFATAAASKSPPGVKSSFFLGIRCPGTFKNYGMLACFNWSTKGCIQGLFLTSLWNVRSEQFRQQFNPETVALLIFKFKDDL